MKRLIAVLTILTFVGTWAVVPIASAQQTDPMRFGGDSQDPGSPSALEGGYITGNGQFQWLMIGAPRGAIDGNSSIEGNVAHLWFYNAACNRVVDKAGPLTENRSKVFALHNPGFLTGPRVGNVIVAAISPFTGPFQPVAATNAIIGEMFYVDINRGIGRLEEVATNPATSSQNAWQPYSGAHVILFAPPDDGVNFFDTLILRCPVGASVTSQGTVFGTAGTLGGDMVELYNQSISSQTVGDGYLSTASSVTTRWIIFNSSASDPSGLFAKALSAAVYNLDEEFQESVDNLGCQCIGTATSPEVRLSTLSAFSATHESYWELQSFNSGGLDDAWTADLNVRLTVAGLLNVNFYHRLHRVPGSQGLSP
jgi:hypothetical protein